MVIGRILIYNQAKIVLSKSDVGVSKTVSKFLSFLKLCSHIVTAESHFEIHPSKEGYELKVGDTCVDANDFKDEIMELYEVYFKMKGH